MQFYRLNNRRDNYQTPKALYEELDKEFHFDYDPCPLNPIGLRDRDGLGEWKGHSIFINPPYSKPRPWIENALKQKDKTIVMLLKADTSTNWFHDLILPNAEIRFIRGRLHFNEKGPAPFPSMVVIISK